MQEPIVALELTAADAGLRRRSPASSRAAAPTNAAPVPGSSRSSTSPSWSTTGSSRCPFIDFREAPDGIDGAAGMQIAGDLTPETARRLAALLSAGPLAAGLEADG